METRDHALAIVRFQEYDAALAKMLPRKADQLAFDGAVDTYLAADPEAGDRIAGSGGFRKVRVARPDQSAGKSGGARVIYYYITRARTVFIFTVYAKNVADSLSANGKKTLRAVAAALDNYDAPSRQ